MAVNGNTTRNIVAALLMVTATPRTDSAGQLEAIHYRTVNARRSETSVVKAAILEAKIEAAPAIAVEQA